MRITNRNIYDGVARNLSRVSEEMFKANTVVSSGKRINTISDDPVGLVSVLDLRSSLSNIEQLERNIAAGRSWLDMAESALGQIGDILSQTKALCVEMVDSTKGASERQNAAATLEGHLNQILSLANTEVGGRSIFGGTRTDTAPFVYDDTGTPPTVTYQGNDTAFSVKIGRDTNLAVGRDGETIFGDDDFDWSDSNAGQANIFKTLLDLKSSLQNNEIGGIEKAMTRLDDHMQTIRTLVSDTGAKTTRLDVKEQIIQDLDLTYTDRMCSLEDADIAEAIMDLKGKELAYQAALSSSSKIMSLSLVDYL